MTVERYTITLALASAESGDPPSELRIFPKGKFATKKGTFAFDEKSAASVMAEYADHGADKHFDYWHDSLKSEMRGADRVAAAWHKLEIREGELWATDIQWTPTASDQVRNKQFKYLSPAFTVDKASGRIIELISTSLVNLPATKNQRPLIAAEAGEHPEGYSMKIVALTLGLPADTQEDEIVARLARDVEFIKEAVRLSGQTDTRAAIGALSGIKEKADRCTAAEAKLAQLEVDSKKAKAASLIDSAIKDLRLKPRNKAFAESLANQRHRSARGISRDSRARAS